MTEQQQEQLESLTSSLQAKEREIEQLKYDLIVSLFLLSHSQDCSTRLEAEKKERQEVVMQNTDRLQQLVALQTEMGLERQRCAQDTERLAFLEKETLRLTGELQRTQGDYRSVEENYREAVNRIAKLEADIACAKADWSGIDKSSQCFDKRIGAEVRGVRTDNGNVARTPSTSGAPRKTTTNTRRREAGITETE